MQDNPKAGPDVSRRGFLKGVAIAGVSAVIPTDKTPTAVETKDEPALGNFQVPTRPLGNTGLKYSILGMGGFHLATVTDQTEINNMVAKATDHGINIFDNAWEYLNGLSEERLGVALRGRRDSVIVMSSVCTHGREQDVAMRMLEESLVPLQTDHLDVWQIHEVIYHNDPELIYAPDGVLEALTKAKQQATCVSSASTGTSTRRFTWRCSTVAMFSIRSRCLSIHWTQTSVALSATFCPSRTGAESQS